jgi:hypothetical protein
MGHGFEYTPCPSTRSAYENTYTRTRRSSRTQGFDNTKLSSTQRGIRVHLMSSRTPTRPSSTPCSDSRARSGPITPKVREHKIRVYHIFEYTKRCPIPPASSRTRESSESDFVYSVRVLGDREVEPFPVIRTPFLEQYRFIWKWWKP